MKVTFELEIRMDLVQETGDPNHPDGVCGWTDTFETDEGHPSGWTWKDVAIAIASEALCAGNFTEYTYSNGVPDVTVEE